MQPTKKRLKGLKPKNPLQKLITVVARTEAVSMAYYQVSTAPNMANGFVKHLNTKLFGKIVAHPKIVVAREQINRNALVGPLS